MSTAALAAATAMTSRTVRPIVRVSQARGVMGGLEGKVDELLCYCRVHVEDGQPEEESCDHHGTVIQGGVFGDVLGCPEEEGQDDADGDRADDKNLSLIHISEPTRQAEISYAV